MTIEAERGDNGDLLPVEETDSERGEGQQDRSAAAGPGEASLKGLHPARCRSFARKRVAAAFPEIVESFLTKAKEGSVPHTNFLTAMGGFSKRPAPAPVPKPKGKTLVRRMIEEIDAFEASRSDRGTGGNVSSSPETKQERLERP